MAITTGLGLGAGLAGGFAAGRALLLSLRIGAGGLLALLGAGVAGRAGLAKR